MLSSVVESFSAKAQMVNSLPGCWDRNLATLTRPLTSIQPSPFCCAWRSSPCVPTKASGVYALKRTLLGLGLRRSRQPQLIEKVKKMRQAVAASARAAPSTVLGLAAHRRLTFFKPRPKGVSCRILPWTSRPHQAGGPCRTRRWHPSLQKVNMANSPPGCRDRKFETFKTRPFKTTHTSPFCHLPWCTLPLRNHPLHRRRPLLRPQVCRRRHLARTFLTTSGGWIMSNSAVASFSVGVKMADSPPRCWDKKFGTLKTRPCKNHPDVDFVHGESTRCFLFFLRWHSGRRIHGVFVRSTFQLGALHITSECTSYSAIRAQHSRFLLNSQAARAVMHD